MNQSVYVMDKDIILFCVLRSFEVTPCIGGKKEIYMEERGTKNGL